MSERILQTRLASLIAIYYIGSKPLKRDTVAGTNFVWEGFGAKRNVPEDVAARLLQHPDIWVDEQDFAEKYEGQELPRANVLAAAAEDGDIDLGDLIVDDEDDDGGAPVSEDDPIIAALLDMDIGDVMPSIEQVRAVMGDGAKVTKKSLAAAWAKLKA